MTSTHLPLLVSLWWSTAIDSTHRSVLDAKRRQIAANKFRHVFTLISDSIMLTLLGADDHIPHRAFTHTNGIEKKQFCRSLCRLAMLHSPKKTSPVAWLLRLYLSCVDESGHLRNRAMPLRSGGSQSRVMALARACTPAEQLSEMKMLLKGWQTLPNHGNCFVRLSPKYIRLDDDAFFEAHLQEFGVQSRAYGPPTPRSYSEEINAEDLETERYFFHPSALVEQAPVMKLQHPGPFSLWCQKNNISLLEEAHVVNEDIGPEEPGDVQLDKLRREYEARNRQSKSAPSTRYELSDRDDLSRIHSAQPDYLTGWRTASLMKPVRGDRFAATFRSPRLALSKPAEGENEIEQMGSLRVRLSTANGKKKKLYKKHRPPTRPRTSGPATIISSNSRVSFMGPVRRRQRSRSSVSGMDARVRVLSARTRTKRVPTPALFESLQFSTTSSMRPSTRAAQIPHPPVIEKVISRKNPSSMVNDELRPNAVSTEDMYVSQQETKRKLKTLRGNNLSLMSRVVQATETLDRKLTDLEKELQVYD